MSSAVQAPVQSPSLYGENQPKMQSRKMTHNRLKQIACVLVLVFMDIFAIGGCLVTATLVRIYLLGRIFPNIKPLPFSWSCYTVTFGWIWLVLLIFIGVEGLYTQRRSAWNEIGHLIKAIGLGIIAILATVTLTELNPFVSRFTTVLTASNLFICLPIMRYWSKRTLKKWGIWRKRILIIGAADAAQLIIQGLASDPFLGYEIAGVLDDDPLRKGESLGIWGDKSIIILGSILEIREQMFRTQARDILIAMPDLPEEKLLGLLQRLQPDCDSIYLVPHLWELPMMNLQVDGFLRQRVMMLKLSNNLAKPWNNWLKRSIDLLLASVLVLLTLPLGLIIAILIKLDSNGPALFVQDRLGWHGRHFQFYKFRTMHVDGDERLAEHLESDPYAAEEWRVYAKLRKYDPRTTRFTRFLRHWSLDELPQLINVLKGDMSLVGPRPYLPNESSRIGLNLSTILSTRPGVTGFWQVNGRNHLTIDERVQIESWYVRNWTVWLDCIVLAKTFGAVLFPGASKYTSNHPTFANEHSANVRPLDESTFQSRDEVLVDNAGD